MGAEISSITADWNSIITDGGIKLDFAYIPNEEHSLRWGLASVYHHFFPGEANMKVGGLSDWISDSASVDRHMKMNPVQALENAIYISNEQEINEHFVLKYGIRFSAFSNIGRDTVYYYDKNYNVTKKVGYAAGDFYHTNFGFEPRIGLNYIIDEKQSLKANYSRTIQYMQLAQNSSAGNPLDVWFPTNPNIKPQIADMFSVGYFRNFSDNTYETSAEIYYKNISNCIDFKEHSNVIMNERLYGEIRTGKGRAYGLELMVKKSAGTLTGWVSYTLSRSERKIEAINEGKYYLSPYDRTHNFTIVLNYKIAERHQISANWVYYTGNATTFPSGKAYINGSIIPVYTERNGYRMPDYHRLDVSYTFSSRPKKTFNWDLNIGLYNAYNKHNAWMVLFNQDEQNTNRSYAEKLYLFGIVPSITFNFYF
jgi:outer membrane receptor for ferrienterochelin and colicin